jgi:23S rRNA pseudouridine955/2504/2580 synthase
MVAVDPDDEIDEDEAGKRAITDYAVVDQAGREVAWVAFRPLTGRTHQLRVHAAALGTPILGDGKYGGKAAFLEGRGLSRKLHLHARRVVLPRPGGGRLDVTAPLEDHMRASWRFFGFDADSREDPFAELR